MILPDQAGIEVDELIFGVDRYTRANFDHRVEQSVGDWAGDEFG
jgi:hypothetical protein